MPPWLDDGEMLTEEVAVGEYLADNQCPGTLAPITAKVECARLNVLNLIT